MTLEEVINDFHILIASWYLKGNQSWNVMSRFTRFPTFAELDLQANRDMKNVGRKKKLFMLLWIMGLNRNK